MTSLTHSFSLQVSVSIDLSLYILITAYLEQMEFMNWEQTMRQTSVEKNSQMIISRH